jgi:glycerol-3-phosphate acyltransferase PlsX
MGGDNAPEEIIKGTLQAVEELNVKVLLVGKENLIKDSIDRYGKSFNKKLEIINADDIITNEDKPVKAIRRKKESSMVVGLNLIKEKEGDAFVSAGNTGALLSGGLFIVGRIKGIERPSLAPIIPTIVGNSILLDVGANADCKPEFLYQFGIMGSIYAEKVLNKDNPKVGLINIGTEKTKGSKLYIEAHKLLEESDLNFIGNIESRNLLNSEADVLVCDGFVGNIVLKLTEGLTKELMNQIKVELKSSIRGMIGGALIKNSMRELKSKFDYNEYGGAPLLGLKSPVIKAHGSSKARAFKNAIRQSKIFYESNSIKFIEEKINKED